MTTKSQSNFWPLWGAIAGLGGIFATMTMDQNISVDARKSGVGVIAELDQWRFHVGICVGLVAVFALLAFTAGWIRRLRANPDPLLAEYIIPLGFLASAGALIVGYGFKGSLAVYLDGGMDGGSYPPENLLSIFMINDFAPYLGWWGAAFSAMAIAAASTQSRIVPLWLGIISGVFALIPTVFVLLTGLPGFPGVVIPAWLVLTGITLTIIEHRQATAPALNQVTAPTPNSFAA